MIKARNVWKGLQAYPQAHRVVRQLHLWPYLVIPGVLSLVYVMGLLFVGSIYASDISTYISSHWIPDFMQGNIMSLLTTLLVWFVFPLLGYMSYKYVILIVFSPILSYLSEVVEEKLYHQSAPEFSIKTLFRDFVRGIIITLRNLVLTIVYTFLLWLLVFIPVVGVFLSPLLIVLMQAFYDGFGLFDYTLERKAYSVKQSIRFGRAHRDTIIGTGLGFILMLLIPVVGWFAAPAYGTIAATLNALKIVESQPVPPPEE
jgi:CysZ protein